MKLTILKLQVHILNFVEILHCNFWVCRLMICKVFGNRWRISFCLSRLGVVIPSDFNRWPRGEEVIMLWWLPLCGQENPSSDDQGVCIFRGIFG